MQKVLITGANGFVGYYLAQYLLQKNYVVIATGKGACRLPFTSPNFIYETLDFTAAAAVNDIFEKHEPHVVVHAGALSKPDECELNKEAAFLTNVAGTLYLLKAAETYKSFFLFMSTDFVFDGSRLNYTEGDKPAPVNYYGQTKVLGEEAVQQYAYGWSIVRTILVYGHPRGGRQNVLTFVANGLQSGRHLKIVADQVRKPTYVEDLVQAMGTIIDKKIKGIFGICGKDVMTPYDMALAVANHLKWPAKDIEKVNASTFNEPAKRPSTTGFDLTKAKNELNYEPLTFAEGLQKTFED
jgi:dTDP-4-dehydrorhamnose reductase